MWAYLQTLNQLWRILLTFLATKRTTNRARAKHPAAILAVKSFVDASTKAIPQNDEPRSGRPHALKEDELTRLREHVEEIPRYFCTSLRSRAWPEAGNSAHHTERRAVLPLPNISNAQVISSIAESSPSVLEILAGIVDDLPPVLGLLMVSLDLRLQCRRISLALLR